ncbi:hypothetical protein HZB04_03515 [Candidatus Wolfebacteria bacterium]|nr:hypothetical protein [Candidatus Wolfebacteria bacterium]
MKLPNKKFFAFLAIGAIIGSAIYIYDALNIAKAYTFFAPISSFRNYLEEKIVAPAKKAITSGKNSIEDKFKQTSADLISANVEKAKNKAFLSVKSGIDSGLDALGKILGVEEINNQNNQSTSTSAIKCEQ